MKNHIVLKDESYRVMGACFDVYKDKGNGFLESVYQECLAIELSDREIPFDEHPTLKLTYKSRELRQTYQPDFLCFGQLILEIKAVRSLTDEHRAQVINYLKATGKQLGILVNFGHSPRLEFERFINQSSRTTRDDFSRPSRLS